MQPVETSHDREALISDQPRIVLERRNPDHLVHCGLASRTGQTVTPYEVFEGSSTSDNAVWSAGLQLPWLDRLGCSC